MFNVINLIIIIGGGGWLHWKEVGCLIGRGRTGRGAENFGGSKLPSGISFPEG